MLFEQNPGGMDLLSLFANFFFIFFFLQLTVYNNPTDDFSL